MAGAKVGPLTQAELQAIWESTSDPGFWRPLEQAGEGSGFEAYTQGWAQHARVSEAVDTTTQAMFIEPWSGQTAPPSAGPSQATVTLTLSRTGLLNKALVLAAGTFVDEQIVDWSYSGGVPELTGRRYQLSTALVFEPGQTGPLTVEAQAELPGYGYNNPQPGTLVVVEQQGTGSNNIDAAVRLVVSGDLTVAQSAFVDCIDVPDVFIPQHVGQYVEFDGSSSPNAGTIARIFGYLPSNFAVSPPTGGSVKVSQEQSTQSFAGNFSVTDFVVGELLELHNGGPVSGYGVLLDAQVLAGGSLFLTFAKTNGHAVTNVVGLGSGATATIDVVLDDVELVDTGGVGEESWRILDWVTDWGLSVTNEAQPAGGTAGMLDALGKERGIYRATAEVDDAFRGRVATIADVVTPNAIRRALNRALAPFVWVFREVGSLGFPGVYFDRTSDPDPGCFYDSETCVIACAAVDPFLFQGDQAEMLSIRDAGGNELARGWCQSTTGGFIGPPGTVSLTRVGLNPITPAVIAGAAKIVGLTSGRTCVPSSVLTYALNSNEQRGWLDYTEFRAFFTSTVPYDGAGEFGFAYDSYPRGAYDTAEPYEVAYDGFPIDEASRNIQVWQAIDKVRAGGVGFDLVLDVP